MSGVTGYCAWFTSKRHAGSGDHFPWTSHSRRPGVGAQFKHISQAAVSGTMNLFCDSKPEFELSDWRSTSPRVHDMAPSREPKSERESPVLQRQRRMDAFNKRKNHRTGQAATKFKTKIDTIYSKAPERLSKRSPS